MSFWRHMTPQKSWRQWTPRGGSVTVQLSLANRNVQQRFTKPYKTKQGWQNEISRFKRFRETGTSRFSVNTPVHQHGRRSVVSVATGIQTHNVRDRWVSGGEIKNKTFPAFTLKASARTIPPRSASTFAQKETKDLAKVFPPKHSFTISANEVDVTDSVGPPGRLLQRAAAGWRGHVTGNSWWRLSCCRKRPHVWIFFSTHSDCAKQRMRRLDWKKSSKG